MTLAEVRKNAIHVSIFHSCGMTVERGRNREIFFQLPSAQYLSSLFSGHFNPHSYENTYLTDTTCKITQEIQAGTSLLSLLASQLSGKSLFQCYQESCEAVVSIYNHKSLVVCSSLVVAVCAVLFLVMLRSDLTQQHLLSSLLRRQ